MHYLRKYLENATMLPLMDQQTTPTHKVAIKKLSGSRIEITASISAEEFDKTRSEAVKHIGGDVALPGFRKGHVPEKVLLAKIGEGALLEEMAEIAISKAYPKIIIAEKLDVLGRPSISITKIAHGNPLEFTLTTAVFPAYTLPDYKKIAIKAGKGTGVVVVTDEDITKTLEQIRRMKAQSDAQESGMELDESAPLPEIDDEYVRTLGEFKNLEELKAKLRENMQKEKEREAKDKKRVAIMEAIADETKMELPDIIVEQELLRMEDEFTADVGRMGLDLEQYLKTIKKTKEDVIKEWRPDAEKRAKIQILIGKIADEEKLDPSPEVIAKEAKALRERYPEAPEDRIVSYVHMLMTNDKVFEFLESQTA